MITLFADSDLYLSLSIFHTRLSPHEHVKTSRISAESGGGGGDVQIDDHVRETRHFIAPR